MGELDPGVATFEPAAASAREARSFAADHLNHWMLGDLVNDASLCVSELAANAVLHTRAPFTVTIRRASAGVRIDVLDSCPEQLPVPVPRTGSAQDLTAASTTGRGLQIVAVLASRWGVFTAEGAKTVWVELEPDRQGTAPTAPIVVLGHQHTPGVDTAPLRYLDLPVRPAVLSGIQLDELVRERQLEVLASTRLAEPERGDLFDLLDRSAPVRLAGRHAALRAAADGKDRFDFDLIATEEALASVGALNRLLSTPSARPAAAADDDAQVVAFRAWLVEETVRQRAGRPPTRCSLPTHTGAR